MNILNARVKRLCIGANKFSPLSAVCMQIIQNIIKYLLERLNDTMIDDKRLSRKHKRANNFSCVHFPRLLEKKKKTIVCHIASHSVNYFIQIRCIAKYDEVKNKYINASRVQ